MIAFPQWPNNNFYRQKWMDAALAALDQTLMHVCFASLVFWAAAERRRGMRKLHCSQFATTSLSLQINLPDFSAVRCTGAESWTEQLIHLQGMWVGGLAVLVSEEQEVHGFDEHEEDQYENWVSHLIQCIEAVRACVLLPPRHFFWPIFWSQKLSTESPSSICVLTSISIIGSMAVERLVTIHIINSCSIFGKPCLWRSHYWQFRCTAERVSVVD